MKVNRKMSNMKKEKENQCASLGVVSGVNICTAVRGGGRGGGERMIYIEMIKMK